MLETSRSIPAIRGSILDRNNFPLAVSINQYDLYALKQISEKDYLFTFEELANRKANSIKANSILLKKKKLADYLIYRGWESNLVYKKVNQLF